MAASLTPQDVARLMADPSPDLRAELAEKLANDLSGPGLAVQEVTLAQDIVRLLARDVEDRVRATLAQGLRHSANLPRDVALRLADDIDQVSLPLLADSLVLTDAARPNLGESVADALITYADEPAVVVLMGNGTAKIAEASMNRAVTRFADNDRVKEAMVMRETLPITVSERLVTLVSHKLQQHLVQTHALPDSVASDIVLRSRESAIIHLSMGSSEEELRRMVAQMHHSGRLTPTLILRALCTGDIAFFEAALALKGDVPLANAQILIHEPSRRGLEALYRKADMPMSLFPAIQAAMDVVDETAFDGGPRDLERFRARVISRVLTVAEDFETSDADYLIDKLSDVLVHADGPHTH